MGRIFENEVGNMILGCPGVVSGSNKAVAAEMRPACDKVINYIIDYCVAHTGDEGAETSSQICWDKDIMQSAFEYGLTFLDKDVMTDKMAKITATKVNIDIAKINEGGQ